MYKSVLIILSMFVINVSYGQDDDMHKLVMESYNRTLKNYPKLAKSNIKLKFRTKGSAMAASYTWWSIFRRPSKRKYFVKINKNVQGAYMCFQFDHLKQESRDGVLGHEFAHVDFFNSLSFFGFIKFIINQGLPGGIKKSERATDYRAIEHGLGKELRSWSDETRTKYGLITTKAMPNKFDSRYLKPAEIDSVMKLFPNLYR